VKLFGSLLLLMPLSFAHAISPDEIIREDQRNGIMAATNLVQPVQVSDLQAVYDLKDRALGGRGRQAIYLAVPSHLQRGLLDSISLTHRQDPREERECRSGSDRDCLPAYVSTEVFDSLRTRGNWRYWGGTGSGPLNSKFAEIRDGRGETDNIYEWSRKGHHSVENEKDFSKDEISPALLRIRSVGKDDARIQQVVLKISPPRVAIMDDLIFAQGLKFGDYVTAHGRRYPGNPGMGDYGYALMLESDHRPRHIKLDRSFPVERGSFRLPLKAGQRLVSVDVACGDMKPVPGGADPQRYRGGAYITIRRWVRGVPAEDLVKNFNVGSNGVIRATSQNINRIVGQNEEIEIKAERGHISVMGVRIGAN